MKLIKSDIFSLYDIEVWKNPYNRKHEVDPFFACSYIVKCKDVKFLQSNDFTADIAWDKASGIYVLGTKQQTLKAFDSIKEYTLSHLDRETSCPYRFTLFQSLVDDMALIIGDGMYAQLDHSFCDLLTGCSWDGIGIHGGNCSAIESIMSYSTDEIDEPLKLQLIERFETYRKYPIKKNKTT